MNTPSSKDIIRVARKRKLPSRKVPKGDWQEGIHSRRHAQLVGQLVTYLPHIEEMMIAVLARLLGHPASDNGPARQVFRSIESERARIGLMRALLENASINLEKPKIFDEVIDLFESVKNKRNKFAHGLWFTHKRHRVFISEPSSDMKQVVLATRREVRLSELRHDLARVQELASKINEVITWVDPNPIPVGMMRMRLRWKKKQS